MQRKLGGRWKDEWWKRKCSCHSNNTSSLTDLITAKKKKKKRMYWGIEELELLGKRAEEREEHSGLGPGSSWLQRGDVKLCECETLSNHEWWGRPCEGGSNIQRGCFGKIVCTCVLIFNSLPSPTSREGPTEQQRLALCLQRRCRCLIGKGTKVWGKADSKWSIEICHPYCKIACCRMNWDDYPHAFKCSLFPEK